MRKTYSLHRVRDSVTIREGNEKIILTVDDDANSLALRIMSVTAEIDTAGKDAKKLEDAALRFATVIFGEEQTGKLLDFYRGNKLSVLEISSAYFRDRLGKLITKQQKRAK